MSTLPEEGNVNKMSHKQRRALLKKEKRKAKRKAVAQERQECDGEEEKEKDNSPTFIRQLLDNERREHWQEEAEQQERERQNLLWLEKERQAQQQHQAKLEWEEKEKKRKEEEQRQIREEWEEREKREKEEEEEREKRRDERMTKQNALLKEATSHEYKGDGPCHNPPAPSSYRGGESQQVNCPFFSKVGSCRFGDRCSRSHPMPESSTTILFLGMYTHFELEQNLRDEYDTDLALEYEEGEMYEHFNEFYMDVLPEFKVIGKVVQFKVCCNYEPHLRGNVYVQFAKEADTQKALMQFNGRWYAGRQLSCHFTCVTKWKSAICGQFHRNRCPKGKNCNFLHVFRNPGNEFWEADRDLSPSSGRDRGHWDRSVRHRSRSRSPRRTPRYSSSRRQRSRSRSRYSHRARSRSQDRHSRSVSYRHRSRSRSPSRSTYRTPSHSYSRQTPRRARSRSRSAGRRSRSRSSSIPPSRKKRRSRSGSQSPQNGNNSKPAASVKAAENGQKCDVDMSDSRSDLPEFNELALRTADQEENGHGGTKAHKKRKQKKKHAKDNRNPRSRSRSASIIRSRSRSRSPSTKRHRKHKKKDRHSDKDRQTPTTSVNLDYNADCDEDV